MNETVKRHWKNVTPTSIPITSLGMLAYDARHNEVVLFGGLSDTATGRLNDTWLWNGQSWRQAHPSASPPARSEANIAYDAHHGEIVLFGGVANDGLPLGDTWTWDGTTWTQQHPATSPSPRSQASLVYDAARQQLVLFGGSGLGAGHSTLPMNDTWTWDGSTWTQQHPAAAPSARSGAGLAYAANTRQVVLFGGNGAATQLQDMWTWDGTTWTQQHPTTMPPARGDASMVYDAATAQVVLFAGFGGASGDLGDTWTWNGTSWTRWMPRAARQPSPGAQDLMAAYDDDQQAIVIYASPWSKAAALTSQTWLWDSTRWTAMR